MTPSLRSQLSLGAALLVLVIVAVSGLVIVLQADASDRAALDARLSDRLARVDTDLAKILDGGQHLDPDPGDNYGGLLAGSDSLVRLVVDGQAIVQRGEIPAQPIPALEADGLSTIDIGGVPWRALTATAESGQVRIEVLESLAPIQQRVQSNTWLVSLVTLVATVLALLGGWLVARLVLNPLARLAEGAAAIRVESDTTSRVPAIRAPREVATLSSTLNAMLERLQQSLHATRRFTADAGHELRTPLASLGTYLDILERNPRLPAAKRAELLAAAGLEHRRMVELLGGLQALARGDAGALPPREPVELAALARETVDRARLRHPGHTITVSVGGSVVVEGWREGLRLAVDNLLDNAFVHGTAGGRVELSLEHRGDDVALTVSDDGPGIPDALRERLRERFARGPGTDAPGSGLGLALVEQQAALHGGTLELTASALGGLAATILLPVES